MKTIIFILALSLIGCAQMEQKKQAERDNASLDYYMKTEKPRAESGQIKWSDFYRGAYNKFAESSFSDKGFMMAETALYIEKALQLEDGKITQKEFDLFKLKESAVIASHQDGNRQQAERDENIRRQQALEQFNRNLDRNTYNRPQTTNCYRNGNYVNCTTQ